MEHLEWISDELTVLAEAFGETPSEQRQEIYCQALADIARPQLRVAFRRARYELKYFPKIAELRELAGSLPDTLADGRPGSEEAWARMPKGDRIEEDSVVWCEEERTAYESCRGLLLQGNQVGARVAFKERYEKELRQARSQLRPVQWIVSTGFDIEHRMMTLAAAVRENRITLKSAIHYVPLERQDDFALMLPSSMTAGLLKGTVEQQANLPGLPGLLAKMHMSGVLPDIAKTSPRGAQRTPADRSPEEAHKLRENVTAQIEFLKRSRQKSSTDKLQ